MDEPRDARGRLLAPCGCLKRELPPPTHLEPLFGPVPANVDKLQELLLDRFAASSFNICPYQRLPMMSGVKPLRIFLKEGAEPVAVHRPALIPAHWVDQVREEIVRDIALGVLEKVPHNTPITWCS